MNAQKEEVLLQPLAVANLLKVSKSQVINYIRADLLTAVRIDNEHPFIKFRYLVKDDEKLKFLRQKKKESFNKRMINKLSELK